MRATDYQLIGGASKAVPAFSYPEESWVIHSGKSLDHDEQTPAELRNRVGLLFRCVDIRADSMLTVPWRIYKGDKPVWEYTDDEPPDELEWLADLPEFIRFTEMMFCIKPQVYWYKVRNQHEVPKGLQWFARSTMTPLWDNRDGLTGFKRRINQHDEETYDLDEIVYLWKMNPLHETEVDTSPVEAALAAAKALYNVDLFISQFFERGAIKATLLTLAGNPPKQERERVKNWWGRVAQGVSNAFTAEAINADAVKPVVVGEGIKELSNTDLTGEKREDLVSTLGVPHHKLFSNSANFATAEIDMKNFYKDTILPEFRFIQKMVNKQLLVPAGYRLRHFENEMDIFQEDETGRAQSFSLYVNTGMKHSIAAEMLGLELPEGVNYIDLDDDEEPEEPEDDGDSGEESAESDTVVVTDDTELVAEQRRFRAWAKKRIDRVSFDPTEFSTELLTETDKAAIIAELQEDGDAEDSPFTWQVGQLTPDVVKALVLQADPEDDDNEELLKDEVEARFTRDLERELRRQRNELVPADATEDQVRQAPQRVDEAGQPVRDIMRLHVMRSAELGVGLAFSQLDSVGIGFDWGMAHAQAAEWASQYTFDLVRGINETTRRRLQAAVDEWFRNGLPLHALRQELTSVFGEKRAQSIAQTETTRAAAIGSQIGYEQSGVVIGKEWVTVITDVCPVCEPLHGRQVGLNEEFEPGYALPPRHVNCRCFIRPVLQD